MCGFGEGAATVPVEASGNGGATGKSSTFVTTVGSTGVGGGAGGEGTAARAGGRVDGGCATGSDFARVCAKRRSTTTTSTALADATIAETSLRDGRAGGSLARAKDKLDTCDGSSGMRSFRVGWEWPQRLAASRTRLPTGADASNPLSEAFASPGPLSAASAAERSISAM